MKFKPGIRLVLTWNPLHSGQVEVLLEAAAGAAPNEARTLIARKLANDSQTSLRAARDFIDSHMEDGGSPYRQEATPPLPPKDGDLF